MPAKSPLCFILMPFGRKKDATGLERIFKIVTFTDDVSSCNCNPTIYFANDLVDKGA